MTTKAACAKGSGKSLRKAQPTTSPSSVPPMRSTKRASVVAQRGWQTKTMVSGIQKP